MSSHSLLFRLTPLAIALFSCHAWANTADNSQELATVQVHGNAKSKTTEKSGKYTTGSMNTATGLNISAKETPQSVSVITRQRLNDQAVNSLEDAMKTATGVNVVRDSGLQTRFQSRGFYVDQIGEDGITTNVSGRSGYSAKIDVAPSTDLAVYDHIEVVRGATGLTQSHSEPGGTINLIRKRPTSQFRHLGEISIDRWGGKRAMLDVSGSLNAAKTLRGRAVGVHEHLDSFKDRVKGRKNMLFATTEWDFSERDKLTLGAMYQNSREKPDYAGVMLPCHQEGDVPSWLAKCTEPVTLPRNYYGGADWSKLNTKKTNLFAKYSHFFDNGWKFNTDASYTRSRTDSRVGQFFSEPNRGWAGVAATVSAGEEGRFAAMTIKPIRYRKDDKQYGFKSELTGAFKLFGRQHEAYFGYTYNQENIRSDYVSIGDYSYRIKPSNPGKGSCEAVDNYYNIAGFRGNEIAEPDWPVYDREGNHRFMPDICAGKQMRDRRGRLIDVPAVWRDYNYEEYGNRAKTHGLTASTRFNLGDSWHLLAGMRYTRYKISQTKNQLVLSGDHQSRLAEDPEADFLATADLSGHKFIPYFGLTYDITPQHSLYAGYTKIFKPQEDSDQSLRGFLPPTIGTNYEIGWKASLLQNRLNTSLALFRIDQKNRSITKFDYIHWQTYADPAGRVISKGMDLEISGSLNDNWQLSAGYTYNKSRYVEEERFNKNGGLSFSRHTPEHIFRLYTSYRIPNTGLTVGGGVSAQSKTGSLYNVTQGGYALWDAHLRYEFNRHAAFSLIGTNLGDKTYFENNPNRDRGINNFYGRPRTLTAKLDWKF